MVPFDRQYTTIYWSAIVSIAVLCIVAEIKRDIGRKSRFFHSRSFDALVGNPRQSIAIGICMGKTTVVWLPGSRRV